MNYSDQGGYYQQWHDRSTRNKDKLQAILISLAMLTMSVIALSGLWMVPL